MATTQPQQNNQIVSIPQDYLKNNRVTLFEKYKGTHYPLENKETGMVDFIPLKFDNKQYTADADGRFELQEAVLKKYPKKYQEVSDEPLMTIFDESIKKTSSGRPYVYLDSEHKPTIGYGHLLADKKFTSEQQFIHWLQQPAQKKLRDEWGFENVGGKYVSTTKTTPNAFGELFENDFNKAQDGARRIISDIGYDPEKVPKNLLSGLANMVFQMGEPGVRKYKDAMNALETGNLKAFEEIGRAHV